MKKIWQLQEAKNRLSTVVENALKYGPQTITRHGESAVVVISVKDFNKFKKPKHPLSQFFAESPLKGVELELDRIKDFPRELKL